MANFIDLTGKRFGLLTVVARAPNYEKYSKTHGRVLKYARWDCICDCGDAASMILATDLKSGSQISCGCVRNQKASDRQTTHGMSNTSEYGSWQSMKSRCNNPNSTKFYMYGAVGVSVCTEWNESFEDFFNCLGPKPGPEYTLDRIDSRGNYEPGNVKWSTPSEQSQNTRKPSHGTNRYKNVSFHANIGKWKTYFMIEGVLYTKGYFENEEDAARAIYTYYKEVTGFWPKYCEDVLAELGLT